MQLSIAKDIFGSPWHLDSSGFQQYFPVVVGMINGAVIAEEAEPTENIPFAISANTLSPMAGYYADDQEEDSEEDEPTKEKVVHVLPVRGVMMKHDMLCGPKGTRTLGNRLLRADLDATVIGHVMIIEGPGGAANAVAELADAIKKCTKPVVVWVDGIMASAHMYVGSYAKEILASRADDLIGCIGTMIVYRGRTSKSEEDLFKEREVTIYADDAFEKNEEYEKAINNFDFKLVKERVLNPHNQDFVNDIKANRPGVEDKHLHGRTFRASEVIGSLVDKIGSFDEAVARVVELSGYTKEKSNAGSNGSQASTNNQNQKSMSKKYLKIQAAIGSPDALEVEADGSRTFSPDEMEAVETALASDSSTELQSQLDQANLDVQQANDLVTERDQTIEAHTQTIAQRDQTIQDLNAEVAALKAEPAEAAAAVIPPVNEGAETKPGPVSSKHTDLGAAINAVSEEYLNKKL